MGWGGDEGREKERGQEETQRYTVIRPFKRICAAHTLPIQKKWKTANVKYKYFCLQLPSNQSFYMLITSYWISTGDHRVA